MSVSVAMEGEARSLSTWEMNPLLSSHRSATSSWVSCRCSRSCLSFSPIFTRVPPFRKKCLDKLNIFLSRRFRKTKLFSRKH